MRKLFLILSGMVLAYSPPLSAYFSEPFKVSGPALCQNLKGKATKDLFKLVKLSHYPRYSITICYLFNKPLAEGMIFNQEGLGVCKINAVEINHNLIWSRECYAEELKD